MFKTVRFSGIILMLLIGAVMFSGCGSSSDDSEDTAEITEASSDVAEVSSDTAEESSVTNTETAMLVINEIVAKDRDGGDDWIELYAIGEGSVALGDYSMADDGEGREKSPLPEISLNSGEYLVVRASGEAPEDGSYYVSFKLGSDDAVFLYKNDELVDALDWNDGDAESGYSYGLLPDGTGEASTLTPTPGSANRNAVVVSETSRPEGWSDETHGDADPNYDAVFPEGRVARLDVTIDPADWQMMMDDMTAIYGEFGQGGGMGGEIPEGMELPDGFEPGQMPDDFDPSQLPEGMEIPEDMGGMSGMMDADGRNPIWRPCTVAFEGIQWRHVGIRFKGNSSLSATWGEGVYKMPFRFDFDEFEDEYPEIENQRFYGFKKLALSSNWSDNSFLREKVMADIFRDAGVPSPRTAFYRLYIDYGEGPVYFGLYTMVEIPSEPMMKSQFSDDGGNLYKPEGDGATFAVYDETSFDKETNEDEGDYSDVEALYNAVQAGGTNAEAWRSGLEAVFDADGFTRWLAVNTLAQNWDTYGVMAHNYFLYNDPGDGLLHWIPWDNNMALSEMGMAILSLGLEEVDESWPLIRYLMDDPVYRVRYLSHLQNTLENVFNPERMQPIYQDAHDLIRPYVAGNEGEIEGYTFMEDPAAFDDELEYLMDQVERRYSVAVEFLSENR